jgi:asparagine synthase (glutamine-hydrolysing)
MFAFAVHDRQTNRFTCCRDAFGIKPFFYDDEDDAFLFGSTHPAMVALRGAPPRRNWQRCYDYLVHGDYDSNDETFIADVCHLPPAHLIEFDMESCSVTRLANWWSPSLIQRGENSLASATEAVREAFRESIRHQLRSDVQIGAALSGGIDSSAVVCAMHRVEPVAEINIFRYIASGTPLNEEK